MVAKELERDPQRSLAMTAAPAAPLESPSPSSSVETNSFTGATPTPASSLDAAEPTKTSSSDPLTLASLRAEPADGGGGDDDELADRLRTIQLSRPTVVPCTFKLKSGSNQLSDR
ncbi:hypothetical protein PINS_up014167 [Pythium insidiosum]|nr:hypothetical protein PINS_up014167 [Pythium insidiosum]